MAKARVNQVAKSVPFDNSTNGFTSADVQGAIEEIGASSSPGFQFSRSGVTGSNTWLQIGSVPSNVTGANNPFGSSELNQVSLSNESATTAVIGIYEHDKITYTQVATITLTAQVRKSQTYTGVNLSLNKELAVKVESGSVKNPVVQLILKGTP